MQLIAGSGSAPELWGSLGLGGGRWVAHHNYVGYPNAQQSLVRELLAWLHHLQGFALPRKRGCPSPGLILPEALQTRDISGYHQPFPSRRLQGDASLPFFLAVTWKQVF